MTARVVVGVDGSEQARAALAFAVEEVRRRGDAVLVALCAYQLPVVHGGLESDVTQLFDDIESLAERDLALELRAVPEGIRVERVVQHGSAARALLTLSQDADLVVVGSRGRGGFRSLLLGSTSHQVVSHAHCPVVVVPGPDRAASYDGPDEED